jgi:thiamine biosynthesis lipoprotein
MFDDVRASVGFTRAGVELNLGSIGKGYALDRVAAHLRAAGIRHFLLHAGYSSILASGSPDGRQGWAIALKDPRQPGSRLGVVRLRDQALSTSGIGEQSFEAGGRRYGHILDPRTGWPSDASVQCTVVAPDAARAEALSTAFFVTDEASVRAYMALEPDVGRLSVRSRSPADPPVTVRLRLAGVTAPAGRANAAQRELPGEWA